MKAIIMVGGAGNRLQPITYEIPKPLIPVKKRPIVNHLIDFLSRHGVDEVGLLASRANEDDFRRWQKAWGDELPVKNVRIFYEDVPRGTFGGFEFVREWLGSDLFIVMNGDDLREMDMVGMVALHKQSGGLGTIALVESADACTKGVPVMDGDRITEFLEKPENPPSNFISAGVYLLDPKVFSYADFTQGQVSIERDIFPKLAAAGMLYGYKIRNGRWYDCNDIAGWERAIKEW